MNGQTKTLFVVIVVLLGISSLMLVYGAVVQIFGISVITNPNKDHYFEGSLYYYDNESLVGTYLCESENCTGVKDKDNLPLLYGSYAFINDLEKIILYDVVSQRQIAVLDEVKYNDLVVSNNYLLASVNNKWGAFNTDIMAVKVPFEYESLDLFYNKETDIYDGNIISANTNDEYYVINENNGIRSKKYDEINYFDEDISIGLINNYVKIYDYDGLEYLWAYDFLEYYNANGLHALIDDKDYLYIYEDFEDNYIYRENIADKTFKFEDEKIYINNKILDI